MYGSHLMLAAAFKAAASTTEFPDDCETLTSSTAPEVSNVSRTTTYPSAPGYSVGASVHVMEPNRKVVGLEIYFIRSRGWSGLLEAEDATPAKAAIANVSRWSALMLIEGE